MERNKTMLLWKTALKSIDAYLELPKHRDSILTDELLNLKRLVASREANEQLIGEVFQSLIGVITSNSYYVNMHCNPSTPESETNLIKEIAEILQKFESTRNQEENEVIRKLREDGIEIEEPSRLPNDTINEIIKKYY